MIGLYEINVPDARSIMQAAVLYAYEYDGSIYQEPDWESAIIDIVGAGRGGMTDRS